MRTHLHLRGGHTAAVLLATALPCLVGAASASAAGNTYYVSPGGFGTGCVNAAMPCDFDYVMKNKLAAATRR